MFGNSETGIIGQWILLGTSPTTSAEYTLFFFQIMFCTTAVTITSGAVAERIRLNTYLFIVCLMSVLTYPVFAQWSWGGVLPGSKSGWLYEMGFVDFAGSTVVHSIGGWVSLAVVLIIGAREGRFSKQGSIYSSNLPLTILGVFLLWAGWFGFNGGSLGTFSESVPRILVNTLFGGIGGGVIGILLSYTYLGYLRLRYAINSSLGGLVAITASCDIASPLSSLLLGGFAAVLNH